MNVGNFIGKWHIQWTAGVDQKLMQQDYVLRIGTGSPLGDQAPRLTGEHAVIVGFAIVDPAGKKVLLSTDGTVDGEAADPHQALWLRLTGSQLRWKGYYQGQPLYIYISAAATFTPGGNRYIHLYGSTTYGDPDQVAVWGGSGTPPPAPSIPPPQKGNG